MNGLSLCSGIGSLDLGIRLADPSYRTVCYVEREAYAAAVLVERMEEGRLDQAPIWNDLTSFNGLDWRGVVDIVVAGLPCQPYSIAGRKQGDKDERYIWPEFFRILREVRPALVFLENVPELLAWFRPIGEELCSMGYEFEAGLYSASEVGAPHKRQRLFVLAHSRSQRWGGWSQGLRQQSQISGRQGPETEAEGPGGSLVYPQEPGLEKREAGAAEPRRPEYPSPYPPGPEEHALWDEIIQEHPETQPAVCRVAHGPSERVDRLRACGNAVVPQTAALAFKSLYQIMGDGKE